MSTPRTAPIVSRKQPRQARSSQLVEAVLDAAIQVLMREGAQRFTTARVAERAGVSVGSLYQYFPNKAAILFRLQTDEWRRTSTMLRGILEARDRPPAERLRRLVHAFLLSECEEAAIRIALNDAAPLYRDAPEAVAAKADNARIFQTFLEESLPELVADRRELAGHLIKMTLSGVGDRFSQTPRTEAEIADWSTALADMLCGYLDGLAAEAGASFQ